MQAALFLPIVHLRAISTGVMSVTDPTAPAQIRSSVFTEVTFGFPRQKVAVDDDIFGVFVIRRSSGTLKRIEAEGIFSLSLLGVSQVDFALRVNDKDYSADEFAYRHSTPYLIDSDAVFFCTLQDVAEFGVAARNDYVMVTATIIDAIGRETTADPLVNHREAYWQLQRPQLAGVYDSANDRLTGGSRTP
jgi:flavin reductase (DIM6/NTAB) family NADH-FMN oxidoreductase RutF